MPIAIGQTAKGATGSGTSIATSSVTTQASGSTFLVVGLTGVGFGFSTPTDSKSNTYALVREVATSAGVRAAVWECVNGTGGATHNATVGLTGGTTAATAFLIEITGAATASARDGENGIEDDASPYTSPSITTTNAADILIGVFGGNSGSNPATHGISGAAPTSGWTINVEETNGASFWTGCVASQVVSATGTYNSGFTESGAGGDCAAFIVAYKEAAPAGPTIDTQPSDATANSGATAQFTVSATTSGGSLTYQWQRSTTGGVSYSNVVGGSGGTTATYTTPTLGFDEHNYLYRCAVTDSNGTTNTRGARLTITPVSPISWLRA